MLEQMEKAAAWLRMDLLGEAMDRGSLPDMPVGVESS